MRATKCLRPCQWEASHDIRKESHTCWFEEVDETVLRGVVISVVVNASSDRGGNRRDVIWLDT